MTEIQGKALSDLVFDWLKPNYKAKYAIDKMQLMHQSLVQDGYVETQRFEQIRTHITTNSTIESSIMTFLTLDPERGRSYYFTDAFESVRIMRDIGLHCFPATVKDRAESMFEVRARFRFVIRTMRDGSTTYGIVVDNSKVCETVTSIIYYLLYRFPNELTGIRNLLIGLKDDLSAQLIKCDDDGVKKSLRYYINELEQETMLININMLA